LHHLLVGQEPFQLRFQDARVVVGAMDVAKPPRAPVLDAALDGVGALAQGLDRLVEREQLREYVLGQTPVGRKTNLRVGM
jgi:hypothetical protein